MLVAVSSVHCVGVSVGNERGFLQLKESSNLYDVVISSGELCHL